MDEGEICPPESAVCRARLLPTAHPAVGSSLPLCRRSLHAGATLSEGIYELPPLAYACPLWCRRC